MLYIIDELIKDLNVSRVTIQRDASKLASKGLVDKIHGGVRLKKEKHTTFRPRFLARLNSR